VEVWVKGEFMSSAEGTTKKEAEQRAARSALDKLLSAEAKQRKRLDRMPDESLVHDPLTVAPEPVAVPQEPESAHEQYTTLSEYLESLLVTVILALFGTSFVVQAFKIPSPSMEKTLLVGDHLLVNKFIFGGRGHWYEKLLPYRDLQRGDISSSNILTRIIRTS